MGYMQVIKEEDEFVPVGPILGVKPEPNGELWFPVIETDQTPNPTYQTRKYVFTGRNVLEIIVDDEDKKYIAQRLESYPSIQDQLDMIYHDGIDAWKSAIAEVKETFPKPSDK